MSRQACRRTHRQSFARGWFVDEAISIVPLSGIRIVPLSGIRIVPLSGIRSGENNLEISLPVTRRKGAEWCYLLGDFGVQVKGSRARITKPVRSLAFSDWTGQGLPFYVGNVTYLIDLDMESSYILRAAHFHSPLLTAAIDGRRIGSIVIAPYEVQLPVSAGAHCLELTACGHRFKAFGPLHMADVDRHFVSPDGWRTSGDYWSPEYRFRPAGLLSRPRIWRLKE